MSVPPPVSIAQRNHPRRSCKDCGWQLASNHPSRLPCPHCGGMRRQYEPAFGATITVEGELQILRRLTRFNPDWFAIQVFLVIAAAGEGYAVAMVSNAIVGAVVGVVIGLVALCAPPATDNIEHQRWVG